jgi:hypothetical protein
MDVVGMVALGFIQLVSPILCLGPVLAPSHPVS